MNKMRKTFINNLIEIAENNKNIWLISADIGFGVLEDFMKKFPDQYINVGISEQAAVGIATGLALKNKIPVVYTINSFLLFRAFEQIRMLAHMSQNEPIHAILVGVGIKDEYTNHGITHYSNGDKECLSALPINVMTPKNKEDIKENLKIAFSKPGVYYIRLSRFDELKEIYDNGK